MSFLKRSLMLLACGLFSQAHASVEAYVKTIQSDPNALYSFFKEMPKGGELHYHFSGGAYAETMLALASTKTHYCLDPHTFVVHSSLPDACHGTNVAQLTQDPSLYHKTINAWSMKNFIPGAESGHDHFFNTFFKFGPTDSDFFSPLLADILLRAANQHERYMEIIAFTMSDEARYASLIESAATFPEKQRLLLNNPDFQNSIRQSVQDSERLLPQTRQALGCDTHPKQAVCAMTIRFQYFVKRNEPFNQVFAQALAGFVAASQSKNIVAVNLVEAEDGLFSLQDYHAHMTIFNFLHHAYPTVHISLHAGELEPQSVTPANLRFHIREAVSIGHAERIGHGVDIAYENNSKHFISQMAKKRVPVEINLTSNRLILNIFGKKHPLNDYIRDHVPVVLSTDDEGILRTDLTRQYVAAVEHHHLDYPTIREINRNALRYSFLPGKSIWTEADTLIPECQSLMSRSCKQFIQDNDKARLQWQLEQDLADFESKYA